MLLTHVTIVVKDQNATLEFYTKKMGFEKKTDYQNPGQPRRLTVGPKGPAHRNGPLAGGRQFGPEVAY